MRTEGLEPSPLAGQDPKSCVSAYSTTSAHWVRARSRSTARLPERPNIDTQSNAVDSRSFIMRSAALRGKTVREPYS